MPVELKGSAIERGIVALVFASGDARVVSSAHPDRSMRAPLRPNVERRIVASCRVHRSCELGCAKRSPDEGHDLECDPSLEARD